MASVDNVQVAVAVISGLVLLSNFALTYVHYRASMLGDASSRERVMRERHGTMKTESGLRYHRQITVSEPRVRDYGFKEWCRSLLPASRYPGYAHFNVSIKHTEWPGITEMNNGRKAPPFPYPSAEDFLQHDKLRELGVTNIVTIQEPQTDSEDELIVNPVVGYRVYVDGADPDDVEVLQESLPGFVEEIERNEDMIEVVDPPKTRKEVRDLEAE